MHLVRTLLIQRVPIGVFQTVLFRLPTLAWHKGTPGQLSGPPAVESSITVEDAVENRGLQPLFCPALVLKGLETL